jgi:hypothetical protein
MIKVIVFSKNCRGAVLYEALKIQRFLLLVGISFFLTSCAASKLDLSLNIQPPQEISKKPVDRVLGIDEFIDLRPQATTNDAKKWLGFIPGVFWLEFISEIPDTYTGFSAYNSGPFRTSFAFAIYNHIEQLGLYKKTVFLPRDKYAVIDFRLEGILNRTHLKETGYYYGSGMYAWVTRIFGLPFVSYEILIDLTLRLRRMATNEVVWTYQVTGSRIDKFYNIYQLTGGKEGKHIISYGISKILEDQMPSVLQSMSIALER